MVPCGYVHARSAGRRQDGSFDVLVSTSVTGDGQAKRFGSVYGYNQKTLRQRMGFASVQFPFAEK